MIIIFKQFCIYVLGSLAVRGINGFLMPFVLGKLSPDEYGMLALIMSAIAVISPIMGLGLRQVLAIEYFHATGPQRLRLIKTMIRMYVVCAIPINICFLCVSFYAGYCATRYTFLLVLFACCIAFVSFFVELLYQLLRYEQYVLSLTAIQLMSAAITGVLTLMGLYVWHLSLASVLLGQAAGAFFCCMVGLYCYYQAHMHTHTPERMTRTTFTYYLWYGIAFIPSMLFSWLLASSDRWFLARYATLHDVGIYAVADMGSQLFQALVLNAWAGAYLPALLSAYQQHPDRLLARERTNLLCMVVCMVVGGIGLGIGAWLCTPLLCRVIPSSYHTAIFYAWQLLAGQLFLFGSYFACCLIQFSRRRYFLGFGLCIPAAINMILNYLLIPRYGLAGCTYATVTAYAIYFLITLCYNLSIQKQLRLRNMYEATTSFYVPAHRDVGSIRDGNNPHPQKDMANL